MLRRKQCGLNTYVKNILPICCSIVLCVLQAVIPIRQCWWWLLKSIFIRCTTRRQWHTTWPSWKLLRISRFHLKWDLLVCRLNMSIMTLSVKPSRCSVSDYVKLLIQIRIRENIVYKFQRHFLESITSFGRSVKHGIL